MSSLVAFRLVRGSLEAIRVRQTAGSLLAAVRSGNEFPVNMLISWCFRGTTTASAGK